MLLLIENIILKFLTTGPVPEVVGTVNKEKKRIIPFCVMTIEKAWIRIKILLLMMMNFDPNM